MATPTPNIGRTTHLLALMKQGDDAFNSRDFEGMKAVHHPKMIAHVAGITGNVGGAAARKLLDEGRKVWVAAY